MDNTLILKSKEQTKILASKLAKTAKLGDIITLSGDLGAGKTSFAQYFIRSLSDDEIDVTSPTFNLLHVHQLKDLEIWHFDLYRLKNSDEIYELGIEDALTQGISLIEWPEIAQAILPKDRLDLRFDFTDEENTRIITFNGSDKWMRLNEKWIKNRVFE
jgi:tRNA threonylcarbamoyl adenosine modification protein YjeE